MSDDKDYSQPGRINWRLYKFLSNALNEYHNHLVVGGKAELKDLKILDNQAELYGRDYPKIMDEYNDTIKKIQIKYGKNNKQISNPEHHKRLQADINLLHDIGTLRFTERNPYPETKESDDYNLDFLDYDIKNVDEDIPIVKKLIDFYYGQLRKEFERKSDLARIRESKRRGKRAYLFLMKYKEYEAGGFKRDAIEEIFGADRKQQIIMDYWIDQLLDYGISTPIFAKAGMGKSNTSSFVSQMVLIMKPQWDIITDLPIIFSPLMDPKNEFTEVKINRFHFVTNMSELLMESANIGLNHRIPAIIIDEFDSALTTDQMRSKGGLNLRQYMYLERHWDTQGPLFIYHTRKDIPVAMRSATISNQVYMVTKYTNYITRRVRRVVSNPESWAYRYEGGQRYLPVPLTSLPYHSWGTSPFTVLDVDMQWLNSHIKGTQEDALKQILDKVPKREWDKEVQKKNKKNGREFDE